MGTNSESQIKDHKVGYKSALDHNYIDIDHQFGDICGASAISINGRQIA